MAASTEYTRVALVTGAAQGIGRAIALRLAKDGLDVAVDDLPSESALIDQVVDEIKQMGRKAIAPTCDISKEDQVQSAVEETVAQLGRLDVLIANAGRASPSKPIVEVDIDYCEAVWDVNIRGTLLCFKHAARHMIKQGSGGRIVAASSIAGLKAIAGAGEYCMSKAAIRSLTQTAALELKDHNITVNAYAPGIINTRVIKSEHDAAFGGTVGAAAKHFMGLPNAKIGEPEDVADVVSYLASPGAHFITGQTVVVDGGIIFN